MIPDSGLRRSRGGDTCLLCLHGWGLNASVWGPLVGCLGGQVQVLAPDLPGHGARAGEGCFGTLRDAVDGLIAGVSGRVIVAGWSLGGLLAVDMARRHPDRVAGVVLLSATPRFVQGPDWPHAVRADVLADFARDLRRDYRATLTRFLALQFHGVPGRTADLRDLKARCLKAPPHDRALAEGLELLRRCDLREAFAALEGPVTAVLGGLDTLVPPAVGDDLRRLRPEMAVHVLPGAGHAALITHAHVVADRILEACHG